jgi:arsenate reductase-like glutaredoxin family protein
MFYNIADNEAIYLYNGNDHENKRARGYVQTLNYKLREIDVTQNPPNARQLAELADRLNIEPNGLINQNSDAYKKHLKGSVLETNQLLEFIVQQPETLSTPIIVSNKEARFLRDDYDAVSKDMANPDINVEEAVSMERRTPKKL